jgi:hypothetical protein
MGVVGNWGKKNKKGQKLSAVQRGRRNSKPKNSINIGGIQNPKISINIILEMYTLEAIRERERERESTCTSMYL